MTPAPSPRPLTEGQERYFRALIKEGTGPAALPELMEALDAERQRAEKAEAERDQMAGNVEVAYRKAQRWEARVEQTEAVIEAMMEQGADGVPCYRWTHGGQLEMPREVERTVRRWLRSRRPAKEGGRA